MTTQDIWHAMLTQAGDDEDYHELNKAHWNAWVSKALNPEERDEVKHLLLDSDDEEGKRLSERLGYDATPPDPQRIVNLKNWDSESALSLRGFIFPRGLLLEDAKIANVVDIRECVFFGPLILKGAQIDGWLRLDKMRAAMAVTFEGARLPQTDARYAIFEDMMTAKDCVFGGAVQFAACTFKQRAFFPSSKFKNNAHFPATNFLENVQFDNATFSNTANFKYCTFGSTASFDLARFERRFPNFHGTVLDHNLSFTAKRRNWPPIDSSPRGDQRRVARIRHAVTQAGLPDDAHFFFQYEMELNVKHQNFWRGLPFRLYGMVSDFGYSISKPSLYLVGLWALCVCLLVLATESPGTWHSPGTMGFHDFLAKLGVSAGNILSFLRFNSTFKPELLQDPNAAVVTISAFESVIGFAFLFFLGLGIRNRFRLK